MDDIEFGITLVTTHVKTLPFPWPKQQMANSAIRAGRVRRDVPAFDLT
jgi:hypothetical protein